VVVVVAPALLATGVPRAGAAESTGVAPLSRDDLDQRLHKVLYKVLIDAYDLYYSEKPNAAAYLLQGATTSLEPLLEHRPELQKTLQVKLAEAQTLSDGRERARTLYLALYVIHERIAEQDIPAPRKGETLWVRLGEKKGVTKIVGEFVEGCLNNPKANFTRNEAYLQTPEKVAALKHNLVLLASALGKGPDKWEGSTMKDIHNNMGITNAEFDAVRSELRLALLHNRVSADDVDYILTAVDAIRRDIVAKGPAPRQNDFDTSLLGRLGGEKKVREIMDALVDRVVQDARVNFSRGGKYRMDEEKIKSLKQQFFDLAIAVGKDKAAYKGRSMLDAHKGMGITDSEFDAFVDDLQQVLRAHNVGPLDVVLIRKLVESKREDIVERPRNVTAPPPEGAPKAAPPGQSRTAGGEPDVSVLWAPLVVPVRLVAKDVGSAVGDLWDLVK
jgi:hemoglobin